MPNVLSHCLIASAALMSLAGLAQAATTTYHVGQGPAGLALQATQGVFEFSQGPYDGNSPESLGGGSAVLSVLNTVLSPLGGATVIVAVQPALFDPEHPWPVSYKVGLNLSSVSYDAESHALQTIGYSGGYGLSASRISGVLTGGALNVTDLRIDFGLGVVTADVAGARSAIGSNPAENFSLSDVALWSFAQAGGAATLSPDSALPGQAYSAAYQAGALQLTADGKDVFRRSLGLLPLGVAALGSADQDPTGFADFSAQVVFAPVPEPGVYAMAFGGLAVLGAVGASRRRRLA